MEGGSWAARLQPGICWPWSTSDSLHSYKIMINVGYKDVQNNPVWIWHLSPGPLLLNSLSPAAFGGWTFWAIACVSSEGRVSLSAKGTAHSRTIQQATLPSHWCANRWQDSPVHTVWQQLSGELRPCQKGWMMAISRSKWGLLQDRRGYPEVKTFTEGSLLEMRVHSSHCRGAHNPAHKKIWVDFH